MQDDGYMAAQLQKSYAAANPDTQTDAVSGSYDMNDLTYAGIYAKTLSDQIQNPNSVWDTQTDDRKLGEYLAKQYGTLQNEMRNEGVSDNMQQLLNNAFEPFMDRFMDSLDKSLDNMQERVKQKPWMSGTVRTNHIDRNSVYRSYQNALGIV